MTELAEGTERVWRVHWSDPNPGDPMTRILEVCPPSLGSCEYAKYEIERIDELTGESTRFGWVHFGGPVTATLNTSEVQSPESNMMVLDKSAVIIKPEYVPEPSSQAMLGAGLLMLAVLVMRRRR